MFRYGAFNCALILLIGCHESAQSPGRDDNPLTDAVVVRQLSGNSREQRERGLVTLQRRSAVSDEILKALVDSFRHETVVHMPGPPAVATRTSNLLIKFAPASVPHLINGLSADDANVRRRSAFTLGELRAHSAIPAIRKAMATEIDLILPRLRSDEEPGIALATFRSMAEAYDKISSSEVLRWLTERLKSSASESEADVLLTTLGQLEPSGPRCDSDVAARCADQWLQWINEMR